MISLLMCLSVSGFTRNVVDEFFMKFLDGIVHRTKIDRLDCGGDLYIFVYVLL